MANDHDFDLVKNKADLLIHKIGNVDLKSKNCINRYLIRSTAILALGKFLVTKNDQLDKYKIKKAKKNKFNENILNHLSDYWKMKVGALR